MTTRTSNGGRRLWGARIPSATLEHKRKPNKYGPVIPRAVYPVNAGMGATIRVPAHGGRTYAAAGNGALIRLDRDAVKVGAKERRELRRRVKKLHEVTVKARELLKGQAQ